MKYFALFLTNLSFITSVCILKQVEPSSIQENYDDSVKQYTNILHSNSIGHLFLTQIMSGSSTRSLIIPFSNDDIYKRSSTFPITELFSTVFTKRNGATTFVSKKGAKMSYGIPGDEVSIFLRRKFVITDLSL